MTVPMDKRILLIVITEAAIEQALLDDMVQLGVRGYTVTDVRGRGSRGVRDATWQETANIRIEAICPRTMAETVLAHLQARYYENYGMVAFLQEIEILRPEKF